MENGFSNSPDCPARTDLARFATGNLAGRAFERIAQHVAGCSSCAASLALLDTPDDPLVFVLRQSAMGEVPTDEPVPGELLAAAHSCGSESPVSKTHPGTAPRRLGKFELLEQLGI